MEPECSLPHSQVPAACPYAQLWVLTSVYSTYLIQGNIIIIIIIIIVLM
jgi:hypothetical protein